MELGTKRAIGLKTLAMIFLGLVAAASFIVFSISVRDTETIWLQTRIFGLAAFIFLFATVTLGELRLLTKIKGNMRLFKYHKPIAIFSVFLVLLHFLSAIFDNYKWGKGLALTKYLGFTFSDKWMVFMSLGTLALYFMLLVSLTSVAGNMQRLGFKRWKAIHFFGYAAFTLAYIHSVNLGTDIKTSSLSPIFSVLFALMFLFTLSLVISRFVHGGIVLSDQWQINLMTIFSILLIFGVAYALISVEKNQESTLAIEREISALQNTTENYERQIWAINNENSDLLNIRGVNIGGFNNDAG